MSKKKPSSRPEPGSGAGVVKEKLSALEAEERRLREEMEALQRKVADSPRQLAEAQRRAEERAEAERKARSEAEKNALFFDQTRPTGAGRSSGPRRAVKLKVEQKTMKQETWVLVIFLIIVVFMLWSALS
ncbi:MAG: hypothetical protein JSR82_03815 [Verrucomicrobia bacterium]|nr:hypothetical protein [Verrucomicrobiota bacterium]